MLLLVDWLNLELEMEDLGLIYILKNQAMPKLYKVGMTRKVVEARIASLKSTSLPYEFESIKTFHSENCMQLEKWLHRRLKDYRVNGKREFFIFPTDAMAKEIVSGMVSIFKPREYTEKERSLLKIEEGSTASKQVKDAGLQSLLQVSELTKISVQTLINWFHHRPELFNIIIIGCVYKAGTVDFIEKYKAIESITRSLK